ncbi:MAG TPA: hypothetical protein VGG16_17925 [Streptosporangiaceae bacterium]
MLTRKAKVLTVAGAAAVGLAGAGTFAATAHASLPASYPTYAVKQVLHGANLRHVNSETGKKEALTSPDDITQYNGTLYAAFQNGVGPQGQASSSGNKDSTVVEFKPGGTVVAQWDVAGKCDGLTANPSTGEIIATVNEDANSSLYGITPGGQLTHYTYNKALPHKGGTDAVSFYKGTMLVSASAPGTSGAAAPHAGYPAVYSVTLNQASKAATVKAYYYDEASAKIANNPGGLGTGVKLALTDPDSNEVVPSGVPRWGGDFLLTSQGDKVQIYSSNPGSLWELKLSQSVDDTVFPTSAKGAVYATDPASDTVDSVDSATFWPDSAFVAATPCAANNAGGGCAANYLGLLNLVNGQISKVNLTGANLQPQGMTFLSTGGAPAPIVPRS